MKDLQTSLTLYEYSQFEAERKDNYIVSILDGLMICCFVY